MIKIFSFILPLFLHTMAVAVATSQGADIRGDIEKELRKHYENGTLIIRNFYSDDHLKYNPDGVLTSGGKSGIWTLDGFIKINKIKVKKDKLELSGMRLLWSYDQQAKKSVYFPGSKEVKIEIGPYVSVPDFSTANKAIRGVFLRIDELSSEVPGYWKNFVIKEFGGSDTSVNKSRKKEESAPPKITAVSKPSPKMSRVVTSELISKTNPEYPALARRLRVSGTIVVLTHVDKEGHPEVRDIVNPLGVGLEESAVKAISKWVYSPTYVDGEPIEVIATITINFTLGK